jgi:glutamate synthase domain-containing protein 2
VGEVRKFFDGPIALSGSIATGDAILAAQAMGADFAYIGSRWLATQGIERQRRLPQRDRGIERRPTSSTRTCSPACTATT